MLVAVERARGGIECALQGPIRRDRLPLPETGMAEIEKKLRVCPSTQGSLVVFGRLFEEKPTMEIEAGFKVAPRALLRRRRRVRLKRRWRKR